MRISVSWLDNMRLLLQGDERTACYTWERFEADLLGKREPTEALLVGSALHEVLAEPERHLHGHFYVAGDPPKAFQRAGVEHALALLPTPRTTEVWEQLDVCGHTLAAKADVLSGLWGIDHKAKLFTRVPSCGPTLKLVEFEDSFQWRAYLEIYGLQRFSYNVLPVEVLGRKWPGQYRVLEPARYDTYRYPGLREDLEAGVRRFAQLCQDTGIDVKLAARREAYLAKRRKQKEEQRA